MIRREEELQSPHGRTGKSSEYCIVSRSDSALSTREMSNVDRDPNYLI